MRSHRVRRVVVLVVAVSSAAFGFNAVASTMAEPPGTTTVTVGAAQSYLPRATSGARDDYHCFLLDPGVDRDVFVTDTRFRPGVPAIVHHIILFRVEPEQVAAARSLDRRNPGAGWSCFGGTGVDDLSRRPQGLNDAGWVSAWAPSRRRNRLPSTVGVPLRQGSLLVMQVHYSLSARPRPDRTRAVLTLVPQAGSSIKPLRTMLLPAPVELACLPGERGRLCNRTAALSDLARRHGAQAAFVPTGLLAFCGRDATAPRPMTTTTCRLRFDENVTIQAAAGHMHLLGKSFKLELRPGTSRSRTIVSIPRWDFRNQQIYVLPTPVQADTGDVLRVTCSYDRLLRKARVFAGPRTPRYILWGEGTSDEMCLGVLQVTSR